jgi:hypothetical protein
MRGGGGLADKAPHLMAEEGAGGSEEPSTPRRPPPVFSRGAAVQCGSGYAVTVCEQDGVVVTSNPYAGTLSVFRIQEVSPSGVYVGGGCIGFLPSAVAPALTTHAPYLPLAA